MSDENKTREQLLDELTTLRQRVAELEAAETERKQAEEVLRDAREQLSATLNALPDLMFVVDKEGRFYDYRALQSELFDVSPEEFLGKTVEQVLPGDSAAIVIDAIRERFKPDLSDAEQEFIRPEFERLMEEIDDPLTDHARRSAIGERLCVIGDTRPGVGLRPDGLPDILWCAVPDGGIVLEDNWGKPIDTFKVEPCYIAKYPVTHVQFQVFLDDPEGFECDEWWEGLTPEYRKQEMRGQRFKFANHPRDSISWYQAVAFCRWLSAKTPLSALPPLAGGEKRVIRLPTEWEWQQAATGGDPDKAYPWGPEWDGSRANTTESGLSRTMAVGMYPQNASPYGLLDMSGNVWEWCLNEPGEPRNMQLGGPERRVLRGGSWAYDQLDARAFSRGDDKPIFRHDDWGVRLCCGHPPSW